MTAHFYDRHTGILGPGVPLPKPVVLVAARWDGKDGDPEQVVRELRKAMAGSEVRDIPPGAKHPSGLTDFGMIGLTWPADGFPRYSWRVLKYRPVRS